LVHHSGKWCQNHCHVHYQWRISFRGIDCRVGKAFIGESVAIRPSTLDGVLESITVINVFAEIDLHGSSKAK
jgi:hypothetical protein